MSLTHVTDRIHRVDSELGTRRLYQWIVIGDSGALLLDTGVAGSVTDAVVPALEQLGIGAGGLTEVIVSHADVDHYGGDGELRAIRPDLRIRSHELDRPLIESWERIAAERYGWYEQHGLGYDEETWDWLRGAAGADTSLDGTLAAGERIAITVDGREVAILVPPSQRPTWISREDFVRRFFRHQADPGLRDDLRQLAPDTTDDISEP